MPTIPPTIDPAPTPAPQRGDRATFSDRVDAFVTWLTAAVAQFGAVATNTYNNALDAMGFATAADASADAAAASAVEAAASAANASDAANVTKWVAGTNYAEGDVTWSPTNFRNYRAKVALNPSNTDPAADAANWEPLTVTAFSQIEVLSIAANTSLTSASKNVVRVAATVRGASLLLPAGNSLAGLTGAFAIRNTGLISLPLRNQAGELLAVVPPGASCWAVLHDAGSSAGTWFVMCPEGRSAFVTGAAQINSTAYTWATVSAIPGAANKALLAYVQSTLMNLRIATLNADGTVSLGTAATLTASGGFGEMACACDATRGIAAGFISAGNYNAYSLTLDTSANTVTVSAALNLGFTPNAYYEPQPVVLDTTRVAWLAQASAAPATRIVVATHGGAGAPTATARDVTTEVGNDKGSSIVGIGSGQLLASGNVATTLYTSSGNTLTVGSTIATANFYESGISINWTRGFNTATGKAIFVTGLDSPSSPTHGLRDRQVSYTWSGTTLATTVPSSGGFPAAVHMGSPYAGAFAAGSSYCVFGNAETASTTTIRVSGAMLRVMRAAGDSLAEVAFNTPDGMPFNSPATSQKTTLRAAAVNGTKCIAVTGGQSNFPWVMGLEVIKV